MCPKILSGVMAALLAVLGSAPNARAQAAAGFGAFVVENPTPNRIHYQVRWGDDTYESFTVLPGRAKWHSHRLNAGGKVPAPEIRFDGVGNGWLSARVAVRAVNNPEDGKEYEFRYSPDGRCLDLYPK